MLYISKAILNRSSLILQHIIIREVWRLEFMRLRRAIIILAVLSFFLLILLIFRPVPLVPESKCIVHTGEVQDVFEAGVKDVVLRMENTPTRFYINRGLKQGLILDSLRAQLIGKQVTVKYPPYWTPLDPKDKVKHISKLEYNDIVIFSELRD